MQSRKLKRLQFKNGCVALLGRGVLWPLKGIVIWPSSARFIILGEEFVVSHLGLVQYDSLSQKFRDQIILCCAFAGFHSNQMGMKLDDSIDWQVLAVWG